jgi:hypothetical protein
MTHFGLESKSMLHSYGARELLDGRTVFPMARKDRLCGGPLARLDGQTTAV